MVSESLPPVPSVGVRAGCGFPYGGAAVIDWVSGSSEPSGAFLGTFSAVKKYQTVKGLGAKPRKRTFKVFWGKARERVAPIFRGQREHFEKKNL
jgi:hypothetical protein